MYILGLTLLPQHRFLFAVCVCLYCLKDPSNLKWPQTSTLLLCLTEIRVSLNTPSPSIKLLVLVSCTSTTLLKPNLLVSQIDSVIKCLCIVTVY